MTKEPEKDEPSATASEEPRAAATSKPKKSPAKRARKSKKKKPRVDLDDALALASMGAEEVTGVGLGKRVLDKLRVIAAKEYIEEIARLNATIEEQHEAMNHLVRGGERTLKLVLDQDLEIEDLKARLEKAEGELSMNSLATEPVSD